MTSDIDLRSFEPNAKFEILYPQATNVDAESLSPATSNRWPSVGRLTAFGLGLSTGILSAGFGAGFSVLKAERSSCKSSTALALDQQYDNINNLTAELASCNSSLYLSEKDRVGMYAAWGACEGNLAICNGAQPSHIIVTPTT